MRVNAEGDFSLPYLVNGNRALSRLIYLSMVIREETQQLMAAPAYSSSSCSELLTVVMKNRAALGFLDYFLIINAAHQSLVLCGHGNICGVHANNYDLAPAQIVLVSVLCPFVQKTTLLL